MHTCTASRCTFVMPVRSRQMSINLLFYHPKKRILLQRKLTIVNHGQACMAGNSTLVMLCLSLKPQAEPLQGQKPESLPSAEGVPVAVADEERNKLFQARIASVISSILLAASDESAPARPFFPIKTVLAAINSLPNQRDSQKNKHILWSQASCWPSKIVHLGRNACKTAGHTMLFRVHSHKLLDAYH